MEAVDVLGHHGFDQPSSLELGEGEVARVRLGTRQKREAEGVELPDLERVAPERRNRRVLHRVILGPDSGGRAEVGNAALG
jgi:hypothetical protein